MNTQTAKYIHFKLTIIFDVIYLTQVYKLMKYLDLVYDS